MAGLQAKPSLPSITPEVLDRVDIDRFSRQLSLLRMEGQLALASSTVAIVGLGGLGSVASLYLAAAGVGRLILVDRDTVEPSNLNRQILYRSSDVGKPKAVVAAERIRSLFPKAEVIPIPEELDSSLASEVAREADVIVDALDNWRSRLALDREAWRMGKPLVHAAAERFYGQATTVKRGVTSCLACISPRDVDRAGCQFILGPVVGVLGSIQAMEAIKLISGLGDPLYNKLLIIDALNYRIDTISLKPLECEACLMKLHRV